MREWWKKVRRLRRPWRALDVLEKAAWVVWIGYLVFAITSGVFFKAGGFESVMRGRSAEAIIRFVLVFMGLRMAFPLFAAGLMVIGNRRFRRRLRAHRFGLCPKCLYDVRRLAACPECGELMPEGGASRAWRERMPNRKRRRAREPWWKYGGVGIGDSTRDR